MNYPDRIVLVLTYKHDPADEEIFTEKVDAEKVGDYYRLVHVPAFAPNIAYGDVVKVEFDEGEYHFDELMEESGFSVAHLVIRKQASKERIVAALNVFGCGVNTHVADNYVVVSIPPQLSYQPIRSYLYQAFDAGDIDFKDTISKIHRQQLE
ncbi:DUF4265 domain-containing protein [Paraflavitalea pollutisoli]|uniref:DUF4265 domain-containing protein n=1 Tax=Paraflavitalea pollutisoli TaxID=3034143 RepID=UPI0023EDD8AA|nr:DUF4265 domain-containing protein [Paraflavitalea sp. H1-2-19X]